MSLYNKENHPKTLLLECVKNGNISGKIVARVKQAEEVHTALLQIMDNTDIDTSSGIQLDEIGNIFGELRDGDDDSIYAARIHTKIQILKGYGDYNTLYLVLNALLPALTFCGIIPLYPAKIVVFIDQHLYGRRRTLFKSLLAAGVGMELSYLPEGQPFVFINDDGTIPAIGRGFNDITGEGGHLVELSVEEQ